MNKKDIMKMLKVLGLEFVEQEPDKTIYKHDPKKSDSVIYVYSRGLVFEFKKDKLVDIWCLE